MLFGKGGGSVLRARAGSPAMSLVCEMDCAGGLESLLGSGALGTFSADTDPRGAATRTIWGGIVALRGGIGRAFSALVLFCMFPPPRAQRGIRSKNRTRSLSRFEARR
jgi:hypothetical protein